MRVWRLWAKALGEKSGGNNEANVVALIRTLIILQAIITLFTLITLPVEYDASKRALIWLKSSNITNTEEIKYADDALRFIPDNTSKANLSDWSSNENLSSFVIKSGKFDVRIGKRDLLAEFLFL